MNEFQQVSTDSLTEGHKNTPRKTYSTLKKPRLSRQSCTVPFRTPFPTSGNRGTWGCSWAFMGAQCLCWWFRVGSGSVQLLSGKQPWRTQHKAQVTLFSSLCCQSITRSKSLKMCYLGKQSNHIREWEHKAHRDIYKWAWAHSFVFQRPGWHKIFFLF